MPTSDLQQEILSLRNPSDLLSQGTEYRAGFRAGYEEARREIAALVGERGKAAANVLVGKSGEHLRDSLMAPKCCEKCRQDAGHLRVTMIVCPICGNKRCPRAQWHEYRCTGSNETGQVGERQPTGGWLPPKNS